MALGEKDGVIKYYFYAQAMVSKALFFLETQINRKTKALQTVIKSNNEGDRAKFKELYTQVVNTLI